MKKVLFTFILISVMITGGYCLKPSAAPAGKKQPKVSCNVLTDKEKAEGWQLLFDGKTISKWHVFNGKDATKGWTIEDGCLKSLGNGGNDLVSVSDFENFEIQLEWRISKGGNSGIFYGVIEEPKYKTPYYTGAEYQLLDDIGFPAKLEESQLTGANYAMHVADKTKKRLQTIGGPEFNISKIVVNGAHVEHWLNGEKILEFERWTHDWNKRRIDSKWKDYPDYGLAKIGKVGLQDHGGCIWFRNIKIRKL